MVASFTTELRNEGLTIPDQQERGRATFQKALHAVMTKEKERAQPYRRAGPGGLCGHAADLVSVPDMG